MCNPHQVTRDFERSVAAYTGAPFCVAVNSCTAALLLALKWCSAPRVTIPKHTYVGVPMSAIHAGSKVEFSDEEWSGAYQIHPTPVWDSARWFTHGLYRALDNRTKGTSVHALVCVSFHATKTLGIEQGGAILLQDPQADAWLRRMRFDGRSEGVAPKDDDIRDIGYHCYMNPSTAAQGLMRMAGLPKYNAPLPNSDYPDLSTKEAFK
jgi:dTDP-4-amino-4,6-dideoxygalactose transaminase